MSQLLKYKIKITAPSEKKLPSFYISEEEKELLDLLSTIIFESIINKSKS